jgi:pilus assembly protein CpaB
VTARRTIILIIALAIGLVAAVSLFSYTSSVEDRAYEGAELVQVYVVTTDVTKGTYGEDAMNNKLVARDKIPQEYRPGNALTTLDPIRGKVAISDFSKGQVIVEGMFVAPNQVPGGAFATQIPKGQVAVTLSIDQVRGVGGNIVPGDKVNVMVKWQGGVLYLYQNVNILAIGASTAPSVGETETPTNPGSDLVTFAVPPEAAQRLVAATTDEEAEVYLALVPKDNQEKSLPPVVADNFLPDRLTPYPDES